jgi:hypothetical protein
MIVYEDEGEGGSSSNVSVKENISHMAKQVTGEGTDRSSVSGKIGGRGKGQEEASKGGRGNRQGKLNRVDKKKQGK